MKTTESKDGRRLRAVLAAMITSRPFVASVAPLWPKEGLFNERAQDLVAWWAVRHFREHGEAIGKAVLHPFEEWAARTRDADARKAVEDFLASLSDEWERGPEVSLEFLQDEATALFQDRQMRKLAEQVQSSLDDGRREDAREAIQGYREPRVGRAQAKRPLKDRSVTDCVWESSTAEPLVSYPGAVGQFFGRQLSRGAFVSFMGPQKAGKSWWLLDVAWEAVRQGRKALYFQVGDMQEVEFWRRWVVRTARHPLEADAWPRAVRLPLAVRPPGTVGEPPAVEATEHEFAGPVTRKEYRRALKKAVGPGEGDLVFDYLPTFGADADGVHARIQELWEGEGWLPDVVVLDYADNLAPPRGTKLEKRDQIGLTWQKLRRTSEVFSLLLVTATQVKASGYGSLWLTRKDFAEDNRKLNHVTGMVGINQSSGEKEADCCRLNWVVLRHGAFSPFRGPHVAMCLDLASPCMASCWGRGRADAPGGSSGFASPGRSQGKKGDSQDTEED